MQTYELFVRGRDIYANSRDVTLVRTSIGIDQVHVLFDSEEWLEFPVTITFAQGDDVVTQSLSLSGVDDSQWVAEGMVTVPYEVIDMVGTIRVTLQGTDSEGRHIITTRSAPLKVVEAGDVDTGEPPGDVPSTDQWQKAYADAVMAANEVNSLLANFESRISALSLEAEAGLQDTVASVMSPATKESLGVVQIGEGLAVTEDGVLSTTLQPSLGLATEQSNALVNLSELAYYAFDTEFDDDGSLMDTVKVKVEALPIATNDSLGVIFPDGATITVDEDGMLHSNVLTHSWDGTVLNVSSASGTSSSNLLGPAGPQGEQGPQGPQGERGPQGDQGDAGEITAVTASVEQDTGTPNVTVTLGGTTSQRTIDFAFTGLKGEKGDTGPSGYVLTDEDIETISDSILARYAVGDNTRY